MSDATTPVDNAQLAAALHSQVADVSARLAKLESADPTNAQRAQIDALQALVENLRAELAALRATTAPAAKAPDTTKRSIWDEVL